MIIRQSSELEQAFKTLYRTAKIMIECGKEVFADVSEYKKKRSSQANAYYWLSNGWVAECLNDAGCTYGEFEIPFTPEIVHDIQKKLFGIKTTTKMTKDEFCDYIYRITAFWQDKTKGEYQPHELPLSYFEKRGYDLEYNLR